MEENEKYLNQNRKNIEQMGVLLISAPLNKFLEDNYNPHTRIVIDLDSVKVIADVLSSPKNYRTGE